MQPQTQHGKRQQQNLRIYLLKILAQSKPATRREPHEDCYWTPPVPKTEEGFSVWNEEDGLWVEITEPPLPQ
jgi:hypothetical protein